MDGFRTVGHPAAIGAVRAMLATHVPHAVLLTGPASVGKHALALDLAAGLLCAGATGGDRPCRSCRACRMVEHGNHPDLHRLEPEGPGGQVGIGGKDGRRGVRDLVTELSLLPVEGVARVAIIRDAHRMNDDAQSALLKTLEEPPAGTTLILVADDEERLLPTVRSRCARIRLGTLGARDIEALLDERALADAPTAARLARLAGGRAGLAVAYATAPEAEAIRSELSRTLLDLLRAGRAARLLAARDLHRTGRRAGHAAGAGTCHASGGCTGPRSRTREPGSRRAALPTLPIRPQRRVPATRRPTPPTSRSPRSPPRSGAARWRCCSTPGATLPGTSRSPRPARRVTSATSRCSRSWRQPRGHSPMAPRRPRSHGSSARRSSWTRTSARSSSSMSSSSAGLGSGPRHERRGRQRARPCDPGPPRGECSRPRPGRRLPRLGAARGHAPRLSTGSSRTRRTGRSGSSRRDRAGSWTAWSSASRRARRRRSSSGCSRAGSPPVACRPGSASSPARIAGTDRPSPGPGVRSARCCPRRSCPPAR